MIELSLRRLAMKTHLLLIGFSCTGKTSLGKKAFEEALLDSDDELLKWIENKEGQPFCHVYEIYMRPGRDRALRLIEEAEKALIDRWAGDTNRKIISLGPGFPLRGDWKQLRDMSYVVLFRRSPQGIYDCMTERRKKSSNAVRKRRNTIIGMLALSWTKTERSFQKKMRSARSRNS